MNPLRVRLTTARRCEIGDDTGSASEESPSILAKAFDLLRAFSTSRRVMTLTELSRAAGLPKSTVHRLLARLRELDAVELVEGGYRISVSFAQLAAVTPANLMRELALPHMARLHHWSGLTVVLGVLRDFEVVVLEQVGSVQWHSESVLVGARLPATSAALGKALLAWDPLDVLAAALPRPLPTLTPASIADPDALIAQLRRVRADNLAVQADETLEGVAGIAAPIVVHRKAVGALGLVHASTTPLRPQAAQALRAAAGGLAVEIREALEASGEERRWMPHRELGAHEADDTRHDIS